MGDKITSRRKFERKKNTQLLALAAPGVAIFFLFAYIPMAGVFIAFKEINYMDGIFFSPWIGFKNFEFFFKSADALMYLRNTLLYNLAGILFGTMVSLAIAIILNEITNRTVVKVYQTILFFPYFISWVIVTLMIFPFFAPTGLLTSVLKITGIDISDFYINIKYWPPFLVLISIWKNTGYSSVIYYAYLMGISVEYYEAARIDGANRLKCVKYITLPLLRPIITMMAILAVGGIFRADFGLFYYVPRNMGQLFPVTQVLDTAIYRMLIGSADIGMTAAAGFFQSIVGLALVLITNGIVRKIEPEISLF